MAAMSSGRPSRGLRLRRRASRCRGVSPRAARAGDTTSPGATALARTPSLPHRDATWRTSALIPALATEYDGRAGVPANAASELVWTMAPPPRCSSNGTARLAHST